MKVKTDSAFACHLPLISDTHEGGVQHRSPAQPPQGQKRGPQCATFSARLHQARELVATWDQLLTPAQAANVNGISPAHLPPDLIRQPIRSSHHCNKQRAEIGAKVELLSGSICVSGPVIYYLPLLANRSGYMAGDEINKNFMCGADAPRYRLENLIKTKSDASDKLIQKHAWQDSFFFFFPISQKQYCRHTFKLNFEE